MNCTHCHNAITPGTEIAVGPYERALLHCPYCLRLLDTPDIDRTPSTTLEHNAMQRETARRRVRGQFLERLRNSSSNGQLRCPICERLLNQNSQALLLSQDHFRCHGCGYDLATHAYREEAYDERRWLPVIYGLADLKNEAKCARCSLAGAVARACQNTLSRTPKYYPVESRLLVNLLARTEWDAPEPDCQESCFAAQQYRSNVGERMKLL